VQIAGSVGVYPNKTYFFLIKKDCLETIDGIIFHIYIDQKTGVINKVHSQ